MLWVSAFIVCCFFWFSLHCLNLLTCLVIVLCARHWVRKTVVNIVRSGMMLSSSRGDNCFWQVANGTNNPRLPHSSQKLNWLEAGPEKLVYFQFISSPEMQPLWLTVQSWTYRISLPHQLIFQLDSELQFLFPLVVL